MPELEQWMVDLLDKAASMSPDEMRAEIDRMNESNGWEEWLPGIPPSD